MIIEDLGFWNPIIINSGNRYGNMNLAGKFYPANFTLKDRKKVFKVSRDALGRDYGFDGSKMYMASQKHQIGTYFEITNDYVNAKPEGWADIDQDILLLKSNVKEVAVGHPVADYPLVIAYDQKQEVISVGHCSPALIDKLLPIYIIDSLQEKFNSNTNDILVYISPAASKESYKHETYPDWITNEKVWEENIIENNGFHIDLKNAVKQELLSRNIKEENIFISQVDTITNSNYYSEYAENHGQLEKAGRNFVGAAFVRKR